MNPTVKERKVLERSRVSFKYDACFQQFIARPTYIVTHLLRNMREVKDLLTYVFSCLSANISRQLRRVQWGNTRHKKLSIPETRLAF